MRGELFDEIVKRGSFQERDAASVVKQIISGIGYLHEVKFIVKLY